MEGSDSGGHVDGEELQKKLELTDVILSSSHAKKSKTFTRSCL